MIFKRQLLNDIELVNTLGFITQAYQEISVLRMKKMRVWVVAARQFLTKLSEVFFDVKTSYKRQIAELVTKKKQAKQELPQTEARELTVFVSANSKLYGDIINRVFIRFMEVAKNPGTDILIIGKLGKSLYEELENKRQYLYFEIPESQVTVSDLKPIIFHLVKYSKISVFYAKFENIIIQTPIVSNITGDEPFSLLQDPTTPIQVEPNVRFLFEPNLEIILDFFQTQVFSALFKQTVHEAHLAYFASRIKAMGDALNNIEAMSTKLMNEKKNMRKSIENRKILERISGISLWS